MKRFILTMPDDLAERVEAYRIKVGLKSTAETHRALLEHGLAPEVPETIKRHTDAMVKQSAEFMATFGPQRAKPGSLLKKR
jgi:hypothetical protein